MVTLLLYGVIWMFALDIQYPEGLPDSIILAGMTYL